MPTFNDKAFYCPVIKAKRYKLKYQFINPIIIINSKKDGLLFTIPPCFIYGYKYNEFIQV